MLSLEEFYASVGASADEIIGRLGGNASLVERFLGKFPADTSMDLLATSLSDADTDTAFRAAHTLKGLCANLGIESLFTKASEVTEMLRASELDDAQAAFPALKSEYERVLGLLKEMGIK